MIEVYAYMNNNICDLAIIDGDKKEVRKIKANQPTEIMGIVYTWDGYNTIRITGYNKETA